MTHMHIPDGVLPVWLWGAGYLLTAVLLAVCLYRLRGMDAKKKIPLLGALAAAMLVAMSLEIFPLAYHLNLSVAVGILLGPALGFIAAFIVNLILALFGHGGITVIGLNTLLLGAEAVLGHTIFYRIAYRLPVFWRAGVSTVIALIFSSLLLIAIVWASQINIGFVLGEHHLHGLAAGTDHGGTEGASLATFAILVLGLGAIGWLVEGAVTGAVIRFLSRVKPDLLAHALHERTCSSAPGRCSP